MSSKKIFVFDTSTFLDNSKSLFDFGTSDIVIPLKVLEEIDNHKKRQDSVGANARDIIRTLDSLREKGSLAKGVRIQKGLGIVRVIPYDKKFDHLLGTLDSSIPDNEIIGTAAMMKSLNPSSVVSLVTRDINLRVKCDSLDIVCQDYKKDKIVKSSSEIYTGFETFVVSDELVAESYKKDVEIPEELSKTLFPNQFVRLVSELDERRSSVLIWNSKLNKLKTLDEYHGGVSKIKPRNKEQQAAFNILLDENIDFVTMTGNAGSGKSILSLSAALELLEKNGSRYHKIIVSRPVMPMGKDIGFLPGPQPLDAKILTPSGWTTMGEIKVGDEVISRDGKPTKVLGVFPKGVKDVYKVTTNDDCSTECCDDHLWFTRTYEEHKRLKSGKVRTLKEIRETFLTNKGKPNHYIPRVEAIEFKKRNLPIPPYTLGVLLGDGSICGSIGFANIDEDLIQKVSREMKDFGCEVVKPKEPSIQYNIRNGVDGPSNNKTAKKVVLRDVITNEIKEYYSIGKALEEIDIERGTLNSRCSKEITVDGIEYKFVDADHRWQNKIKDKLYELDLFGKHAQDKFIPDCYKYSSIEDRAELLRGLMDTDGTVKVRGEAMFCTTSLRLAKDLREIVFSLGGKCNIKTRNRVGKQSKFIGIDGQAHTATSRLQSYEFTVSMPKDGINIFYTKRKASRFGSKYMHRSAIVDVSLVEQKEVQCILVENPEHLYVTDDFIVTHNTMEEKMSPWLGPIYDNLECILNTKEPSKKGKGKTLDYYFDTGIIEIEALTYIRGRSIPNAIIIIDEAQQLSAHEMKTILTRAGEGSKLIASGDLTQQDNPFVDETSNGLTYAIEKMKHLDYTAHISLRKGERSRLATSAADLL